MFYFEVNKKKEQMSNKWNTKYKGETYVYGESPNKYFKNKIRELNRGKILLPADGEGRNGVYASSLDWETYCFDGSSTAKKKAEKLAEKNRVKLHYKVTTAEEADYEADFFDVMALIYAHFPNNRRKIHRKLSKSLKKGGLLILEAFNKKQIKNQRENPKAGGPPNIDMLYDLEEIKIDFEDFEFIEAENAEVQLAEGDHHVGKGNVIRIFAKKK